MPDDLKIKVVVESDPAGAQAAKREVEQVAQAANKGAESAAGATKRWGNAKQALTNTVRGLGLALRGLPGAELISNLINPVTLLAAGIGIVIAKAREMSREIKELLTIPEFKVPLKPLGDLEKAKKGVTEFKDHVLAAVAEIGERLDSELQKLERLTQAGAETNATPGALLGQARNEQVGILKGAEARLGTGQGELLGLVDAAERRKVEAESDKATAGARRQELAQLEAYAADPFHAPVPEFAKDLLNDPRLGATRADRVKELVKQGKDREQLAGKKEAGSRAEYNSARGALLNYAGPTVTDRASAIDWWKKEQAKIMAQRDAAQKSIEDIERRQELNDASTGFAPGLTRDPKAPRRRGPFIEYDYKYGYQPPGTTARRAKAIGGMNDDAVWALATSMDETLSALKALADRQTRESKRLKDQFSAGRNAE